MPVLHPAGPPWSWPDGRTNRPAVWSGSELKAYDPPQRTRPGGARQNALKKRKKKKSPKVFELVGPARPGRDLQSSNLSQDSPRRESVSHPGSNHWEYSSRGKKERVMWRRSASDILNSTWINKRKIRERRKFAHTSSNVSFFRIQIEL